MTLSEPDASDMATISVKLARLHGHHPNITNVLKAAYVLQSELNATVKTSGSDDTMVSTATHKEDRFVKEVNMLKEEVNELLDEKLKELATRFGEDQVSALLHSSAHIHS